MNKITEISIFRALAAIMVIIIHITATSVVNLQDGLLLKTIIVINRFAKPSVPMFVFASGLALFYVYQQKEFELKTFITKRMRVVLIPYLGWCIGYYFYYSLSGTRQFTAVSLIKSIALGTMDYHLYFIVIIIQFYVLFGLIRYLYKKYDPAAVLLTSLVLNLLFIKWVHFQYCDRFFMMYWVYFVFGCYFAVNVESIKRWVYKHKFMITGAFLLAGGYFTYQFYGYQILKKPITGFQVNAVYLGFNLIAILFYFYLSHLIDRKTTPLISKGKKHLLTISDASFYIYLSHPIAIAVSEMMMNLIGIESLFKRLVIDVVFVAITVFPLSIYYTRLRSKVMEKRKVKAYSEGLG